MPKKRSKKREKQIESQIMLGLMAAFFLSYVLTGSIGVSIILTSIVSIIALVFFIYQCIERRKNLRKSGISDIDKMDGIQFEFYLKELYTALGYKTKITQSSGDFGADLILEIGSKRIVVQAKRYSKNVGVKAVQEIKTAQLHYKADESWVVTNSYFTKQATTLAVSNAVVLIDRDLLIKTILKMKNTYTTAAF
jgi:restriction system protein